MSLMQWFFLAEDGREYSATANISASKSAVTVRNIFAIPTKVAGKGVTHPELQVPVMQEFRVTENVRPKVEALLRERLKREAIS